MNLEENTESRVGCGRWEGGKVDMGWRALDCGGIYERLERSRFSQSGGKNKLEERRQAKERETRTFGPTLKAKVREGDDRRI